jgi:hypothetical protein
VIWAVLALLGVPLWLIALGIVLLVFRMRCADEPGTYRCESFGRKAAWTRGHALWVSDVFAWRGSPAAWREDLLQVEHVFLRLPDAAQRGRLRRLGDEAVVATLSAIDGSRIDVGTGGEHREALLGPFARARSLKHLLTSSRADDPQDRRC